MIFGQDSKITGEKISRKCFIDWVNQISDFF